MYIFDQSVLDIQLEKLNRSPPPSVAICGWTKGRFFKSCHRFCGICFKVTLQAHAVIFCLFVSRRMGVSGLVKCAQTGSEEPHGASGN